MNSTQLIQLRKLNTRLKDLTDRATTTVTDLRQYRECTELANELQLIINALRNVTAGLTLVAYDVANRTKPKV